MCRVKVGAGTRYNPTLVNGIPDTIHMVKDMKGTDIQYRRMQMLIRIAIPDMEIIHNKLASLSMGSASSHLIGNVLFSLNGFLTKTSEFLRVFFYSAIIFSSSL